MSKKGFTLVELLGVITILVILIGVAVPTINVVLKDAREDAYKKQIDTLEAAAKKWGVEHDRLLPEVNSNSIITIKFNHLINEGYLKSGKIINPKTKEELEGCIKITYNSEYNQYEYKYTDSESICTAYDVNNL